MKIAIVQIGCGFRNEPYTTSDYKALSLVDFDRTEIVKSILAQLIEATVFLPKRDELQIWTTGMVSWNRLAATSNTLARMNANKLKTNYPEHCHLYREVPGSNAFSECWEACQMAQLHGIEVIILVASEFDMETHERVWRAAARRVGVELAIARMCHKKGVVSPRVSGFYKSFPLQLLSRLAASSKLGHFLVMKLANAMTKTWVTEGFRIDGHTRIS